MTFSFEGRCKTIGQVKKGSVNYNMEVVIGRYGTIVEGVAFLLGFVGGCLLCQPQVVRGTRLHTGHHVGGQEVN